MGRKKTSAQKNAEGTLRSDRNKQQKTGLLDEIPFPAFDLNELALHIFERTCEALMAATALLKFDDKVQKYSSLLGLSIKARDLMASFEKSESETESPIELALRSLNKGN